MQKDYDSKEYRNFSQISRNPEFFQSDLMLKCSYLEKFGISNFFGKKCGI